MSQHNIVAAAAIVDFDAIAIYSDYINTQLHFTPLVACARALSLSL